MARALAAQEGANRAKFLDELPKNNYGKVLKTELRKRLNTA